jgi:hypothetical protein
MPSEFSKVSVVIDNEYKADLRFRISGPGISTKIRRGSRRRMAKSRSNGYGRWGHIGFDLDV